MLPRTMIVSIIGFDLFDCTEFYSFFQPLEVTRHTLLSEDGVPLLRAEEATG